MNGYPISFLYVLWMDTHIISLCVMDGYTISFFCVMVDNPYPCFLGYGWIPHVFPLCVIDGYLIHILSLCAMDEYTISFLCVLWMDTPYPFFVCYE